MPQVTSPKLPDIVLSVGLASLVVVGLGVFGYPLLSEMNRQNKEEAALANAATLQLAAESFAASHQGRYAELAVDLLPYLPDNSAPVNPYTADKMLFQSVAGDLTYRLSEKDRSYVIEVYSEGRGHEPQLLRTLVGKDSQ